MIAAVVAQYGAFTTPLAILWALCLAVAIWRQPAATRRWSSGRVHSRPTGGELMSLPRLRATVCLGGVLALAG